MTTQKMITHSHKKLRGKPQYVPKSYASGLSIRVPGHDLWLRFATTRQFDQMALELYSPIYVHFSDPDVKPSPSFDEIESWRTGVTLSEALDKVFEKVRNSGRFPDNSVRFDRWEVLEALGREIIG